VYTQRKPIHGHTYNVADVTITDTPAGRTIRCECVACGREWWPDLLVGGRAPRGFRQCPAGCILRSLERDARLLERHPPRF
jgi:hypothetical protein